MFKESRAAILSGVLALSLGLGACTVQQNNDQENTKSTNTTVLSLVESSEAQTSAASEDSDSSSLTNMDLAVDVNSLVIPHGAIAIYGVGEANQLDFTVPSWSTIKVPIAIAALRENPELLSDVSLAIQESDNDAANRLWYSLSDPVTQVTDVIEEAGSTAYVLDRQIVPPFTSYGQSPWTVAEQAQFAAGLRCVAGSEEVLNYMSNLTNGGDYGLDIIPGAIFKSGWGPNPDGIYGLRQFGLVPNGEGYVAVALAATSPDGSYEGGQAVLNTMAFNLQQVLEELPANAC